MGERGKREGVDGGEEAVRRSSFKDMSRTVNEKWRAGKAECQLAGSTVKNGGFESRSYFSMKAREKKTRVKTSHQSLWKASMKGFLKVLNEAKQPVKCLLPVLACFAVFVLWSQKGVIVGQKHQQNIAR